MQLPITPQGTPPGSTTKATRSVDANPQVMKLRRAAGEFESLLLSSVWKSLKESFTDEDAESSDPAGSTLDDMGIQAMSEAVGKAGGLGLGKLMLKSLEPKLLRSEAAEEAFDGKLPSPAADIVFSNGLHTGKD